MTASKRLRTLGNALDHPDVSIRRETPRDSAAIARIHAAAFAAPGSPNAVAEVALVEQLWTAGDSIATLSLVAQLEGAIVGHVMASRAQIDDQASVGLGPLGVLPDRHREGVGTALMHAVVAGADALDVPEIVLLGDPGFYCRFGFQSAESIFVIAPDPRLG